MRFLLYGANGYTGQLIIRYAQNYDIEPVLAGRNEAKIKTLAEKYGYDYLVFDLENQGATEAALANFDVVLHAAGPFKFTANAMINACIRTGTHYLDITGEIDVFELAATKDAEAKSSSIMLLSGTGFDVVPTDCLAKYLADLMPNATRLELGFASSGGGFSRGTAMTMVENLGTPSAERVNGAIVNAPYGKHSCWKSFGDKRFFFSSIPWGDVSTAYYSTGIPNIVTYTGMPQRQHRLMRISNWMRWLTQTSLVKNYARKKILASAPGPSDKRRAKARSYVWAKVQNTAGDSKEAQLITPDGYTLTALSSLIIIRKVLCGDFKIGFQTPANAYGADLVLEVGQVERKLVTS